MIWIVGILALLPIIVLLVAAHELGHYLLARAYRMGVEEFAIGFGRKLFAFGRRRYRIPETGETEQTEFTVRLWPLGGFVRIKGMEPRPDGSETQIPGGFYSRSPAARFVVLFAGPVFSFAFGIVLLFALFTTFGIRKPVNEPIVGAVSLGSPAEKAGLRVGDRVLAIDDRPIRTFYEMLVYVRERPEQTLTFLVERPGEGRRTLRITTLRDPRPSPVIGPDLEVTNERRVQGKIGIGWDRRLTPVGIAEASREAFLLPVRIGGGILAMFTRPQTIQDEVGGPATMAAFAAAAAYDGLYSLIFLGALISITLGFMNLLPIPPLDGGQMVIAVVEMLRRGKRLSLQLQHAVTTVGFFLVIFIMLSVILIDVNRFVLRPLGGERPAAERPAPADESPPSP